MPRLALLVILTVVLFSNPAPAVADESVDDALGEIRALTRVLSARLQLLEIYERAGREAEAARSRARIREELELQRAALDELGREVADTLRKEKKAADAAKAPEVDPRVRLIKAYAEGKVSLTMHTGIIAIVKDAKAPPELRKAACDALRARFEGLRHNDPMIRGLKKKISIALIGRLNDRDTSVRGWVHEVFKSFWPGKAAQIGFKPEDASYRVRFKAWKAWREFLRG